MFRVGISNGSAVRAQTNRRTDRQKDGTESITLTADAGGNKGAPKKKAANQNQFNMECKENTLFSNIFGLLFLTSKFPWY